MQPNDAALRSIVAHLAHLRRAYGEVFADPDLVEPTGDYFPDEFTRDPEGVERLLGRMRTYAPLSADVRIDLAFLEPEATSGGGCGSGACGSGAAAKDVARGGAVEAELGYGALVHVADTGDPALLTASLARSLGRIVLFEADEELDPHDEGPLAELTAVACGLGLILLLGACVYKKGCGGVKRHQGTFLGIEELALALAFFVRLEDKKPGVVRRHLEVTQREAFDEALTFVDSQPKLVRTLREAPELLEDGVFSLEAPRGLLSRLLSRVRDGDAKDASAIAVESARPARKRTEQELRRLAETKALVDEALQEP